jgi:hypothetical protein
LTVLLAVALAYGGFLGSGSAEAGGPAATPSSAFVGDSGVAVCAAMAGDPVLGAGPVLFEEPMAGEQLLAAVADDDIPGSPLAIGEAVSETVTAGDVGHVYALTLSEGEEVHLRCDPGESGQC